jgi:acyl-coenzyme A thioesterase PaaI-like protein
MRAPFKYEVVDLTEAELAIEREVFGGLAGSVRSLAEASLRTTIPEDEVGEITREIEKLTARLQASRIDGPFGVTLTSGGGVRGHGNAVVGMRNPIAPPLDIKLSGGEGHVWSHFHLNALYEGPPTLVHGGVTALILDQVLGECAGDGGAPGMTGTLTLRYLRPTPLGDCSAEAWVTEIGETKTHVRGVMRDADGNDTVEATGVFILPRWAREKLAAERTPRFE